MEAEQLAKLFHETYERLAPDFGYKTREASAKPWKDVPDNNKGLMTKVATHVLMAMQNQTAKTVPSQLTTVALEKAVGLLNSMVQGGERHTDESRRIVAQAIGSKKLKGSEL